MKQVTFSTVFDLKLKTQVYDKFTGKYGMITSIKETAPDWIEAFVRWEDSECEEPLPMVPNVYILDEMDYKELSDEQD